jgi:hypothetical protein
VGAPVEITDAPGCLRLRVQERADRQGWTLGGELISTTGIWYRQIIHAVNYAAWRTRGYVSEIQIVNRQGKVTHVVLIDTSEGHDHLLYSRGQWSLDLLVALESEIGPARRVGNRGAFSAAGWLGMAWHEAPFLD